MDSVVESGTPEIKDWEGEGPARGAEDDDDAAARDAVGASEAPLGGANTAKKRGRPRGARNKASRLQIIPAILILRPGDGIKAKLRAYAEKNNVSVAVLSMSGALQSLPMPQLGGGIDGRGGALPGPLMVLTMSGGVLRETVDGTASNTVEKTCWLNVCCALSSGHCFGTAVFPNDDLVVSQVSILLLSTWEPVRMHGVLDTISATIGMFPVGAPSEQPRWSHALPHHLDPGGLPFGGPPFPAGPGAFPDVTPGLAAFPAPVGEMPPASGPTDARGDGRPGQDAMDWRMAHDGLPQRRFTPVGDEDDGGSAERDDKGAKASRVDLGPQYSPGGMYQGLMDAEVTGGITGGGDVKRPTPGAMPFPGATKPAPMSQGLSVPPQRDPYGPPPPYPSMAAQMMQMGLMNLHQGSLDVMVGSHFPAGVPSRWLPGMAGAPNAGLDFATPPYVLTGFRNQAPWMPGRPSSAGPTPTADHLAMMGHPGFQPPPSMEAGGGAPWDAPRHRVRDAAPRAEAPSGGMVPHGLSERLHGVGGSYGSMTPAGMPGGPGALMGANMPAAAPVPRGSSADPLYGPSATRA